MSRIAHKLMAASGGGGGADTEIAEQSLVFDKADAAGLTKTPSSASNQKTWTWSGWVKRIETHASHYMILFSADGNSDNCNFGWYLDNLYFNDYDYDNGVTKWQLTTNAKYRDFSAWYHIVYAVDTTQATASNRLKLYVNGEQVTSFSAETYPSQNHDGKMNSTLEQHIGTGYTSVSNYSAGCYMSEVHFVDGTALTPSSFGETNSTTNQWVPKEVTDVTYGTNGFSLKFASGELGTDSSDNGNDFAVANLANADVVLDTPLNNFATVNPLYVLGITTPALSQGNLKFTGHGSNY